MKSKKCVKCLFTQPLGNFYMNKKYLDGHINYCKDCKKILNLEQRRTRLGVIQTMIGHQRSASKKRGHPEPEYSLNELQEYLLNLAQFHRLYDVWASNNYDKWLKPSLDRLDDNLGYSFSNVRLVTWRENNQLSHERNRS